MTQQQQPKISVIDPINPAIQRTKLVLFKPFDLAKWFTIGFCAWLASLGTNQPIPLNFRFFPRRNQLNFQPDQFLQHAKDFFIDNLPWLIPAALIGGIITIMLWLLFTWLRSRGQFTFLHCVAQNKAEVEIPWAKFKHHANSLFLFRIVLGLIAFTAMFSLGLLVFFFILAARAADSITFAPILPLLLIVTPLSIVAAIVFCLIHKFTTDFVVPIMFLRTTSCITAWRQFWALLSGNLGRFALYILFQIVIALAIGVIILAAVCMTCCCAACILAIPYIGTVLMLPLLVFKRAYPLCYFRQFGPDFDCFVPEITP